MVHFAQNYYLVYRNPQQILKLQFHLTHVNLTSFSVHLSDFSKQPIGFWNLKLFFDTQIKNTSILILLSFKVPSKSFFTRISKQVLLFGTRGFKNCKIYSEFVNMPVGHTLYCVKKYQCVVLTITYCRLEFLRSVIERIKSCYPHVTFFCTAVVIDYHAPYT